MTKEDPRFNPRAVLPHYLTTQRPRTRIQRRVWLAAGTRRRGQVEVADEVGVDQLSGEMPSSNTRQTSHAHRREFLERRYQISRIVDQDRLNPGTMGESVAHLLP